jgi:hypothetical protein
LDKKQEAVLTKNRGTKVLPCSCTNVYQDERYGKGMRVHNEGGKKDRPSYSCTVCGALRH